MDLMRDQSLEEFLTSFKRFLTRRERSEKVYSDNFSKFVAASKWLKDILREEKIHDCLGKIKLSGSSILVALLIGVVSLKESSD